METGERHASACRWFVCSAAFLGVALVLIKTDKLRPCGWVCFNIFRHRAAFANLQMPWLVDGEFHLAGYNIVANCGAAAGQTIFHLHPHVIPRYPAKIHPQLLPRSQNSIGCMICKSLIRDSPE